MSICYWCGKEVLDGEGMREHIVPKTLLQDVSDDVSDFILPAVNAHKVCNKTLGDNYEHDFCQIIFHYSADDPRAAKHIASKVRNLERCKRYAWNQFRKMRTDGYRTEIQLSTSDKKAFEECVKKIVKGLYFKQVGRYLDLEGEYSARIVWNTFNVEHDVVTREQVKKFLGLLGSQNFLGNDVFKFRFKKIENGNSSLWEFLFYNRFPIYLFLIHKDESSGFRSLK